MSAVMGAHHMRRMAAKFDTARRKTAANPPRFRENNKTLSGSGAGRGETLRSTLCGAGNGGFEPNSTDAAICLNGSFARVPRQNNSPQLVG